MKIFFGLRVTGCQVFVWETTRPDVRPWPLDPARELWNHSPDGFEWGYGGSGPAQLALALLYECTQDVDWSIYVHQVVKAALVVTLPHDLWARSEVDILECALRVAIAPESKAKAAHYLAAARNRASYKGSVHHGE